ncbi:MAG: hypothetical protein RLZZ244_504 [Verrucomicrobiota bacterium]|jgi:hypothetical protein
MKRRVHIARGVLWGVVALVLGGMALGQEAGGGSSGKSDASVAAQKGSEDEVRVGAVRIRPKEGRWFFTARLNQAEGPVEYGIVTKRGAVHESLLVTEVSPVELHAAMLLLGWKQPAARYGGRGSGGQIQGEALQRAAEIPGTPVWMRVGWKEDGKPRKAALEEWLAYEDGKEVARGPWNYTGSYLPEGGVFAALEEGCVLCLVLHPAALWNNPRPGNREDHVWMVRKQAVPPVGTEVEVEVILRRPEGGVP